MDSFTTKRRAMTRKVKNITKKDIRGQQEEEGRRGG